MVNFSKKNSRNLIPRQLFIVVKMFKTCQFWECFWQCFLSTYVHTIQVYWNRGCHWHSWYLANQFNLFQPRGQVIPTGIPKNFTFWLPCFCFTKSKIYSLYLLCELVSRSHLRKPGYNQVSSNSNKSSNSYSNPMDCYSSNNNPFWRGNPVRTVTSNSGLDLKSCKENL